MSGTIEQMTPRITLSRACPALVRGSAAAAAPAIAAAPLTRRARAELAYCVIALPLALIGFLAAGLLLVPGLALTASLAGALPGLELLGLLTRVSRLFGRAQLRLAGSRLDARFTRPPPFRAGRGALGRLDARLRDGTGWRAAAYLILKLPLACGGAYLAAVPWLGGTFYLTYPLWWLVLPLRGRGPGGTGRPLPISTPLPFGGLHIVTFPGALAVAALGAGLLLAAPWATRLSVTLDLWLIRTLLARADRSERIRELEESRAQAVDDSAAALRRVERDLHDGAQARLVALAMHLGRAREKLGADGDPADVSRARELIDAAHQGAKDALAELRDLARGIHPPALDGGLEDALASLAARSAVPTELSARIPVRPTPAIETIAYFCVAELLANAGKHSSAGHLSIEATGRDGALLLRVLDDGTGGARQRDGGGLAGLAQRVRTVDGSIRISSPAGGPTAVTIELPLRA
jgi:signal transduction histidine kinase